jgi:2-keto-4-pentenoate hydratase/2-oxohepta-3-ene-1,7-dioic acid hydratase in catechol pathway
LRLARFRAGDTRGYAIYLDDIVQPIEGDPFGEFVPTGEPVPVGYFELMAPVVPSKVVAVGLNYRDHAAEFGMDIPEEPILFLKASSTVVGPGASIVYPRQSERVDYECELAVVIGAEARSVRVNEAFSKVFGYTVSLDITARDLQVKDGQWTRAKNFDTFCPLGPWIETELSPEDLAIELRLNGELRQSSRTDQMIFDVPHLISFISGVMTLYPGDVIMTGTPPGVGEISSGDMIDAYIEGIGALSCDVVAQQVVIGS